MTKINAKRDTCLLRNALISDKDQSKSDEQFMYKTGSFSDPSCQKFSNFLQQQKHKETDEDTNDYYKC